MSVVSQVFVLFYNFTGNTLYDYTFYMYGFTVMAGLAVLRKGCEAETTETGTDRPVLIAASDGYGAV